MKKIKTEEFIVVCGLLGIIALFGSFVFGGIRELLLLIAITAGIAISAALALNCNRGKRIVGCVTVSICVLLFAVAVYADSVESGSNVVIVQNALTYDWSGEIINGYGTDELSKTNMAASVEVSEITTTTDENGTVTDGAFTMTLSATTSTYYTSTGSCNSTVYHRPGKTTVTATISNVDSNRPVKITKVEIEDGSSTSGVEVGISVNTVLSPEGKSAELIVTASPETNSDTTPRNATLTVNIEFEFLDNVGLTVDSSAYSDYSFTNDYNAELTTVAAGSEPAVYEFPVGTVITPTVSVPAGYTFHGWRLSDGRLLTPSADSNVTFSLSTDTTLYPVFLTADEVSAGKVFQVGATAASDGSNQFWFYEDAAAYAVSNGSDRIILLRDYDLRGTAHESGVTRNGGTYTKVTDRGVDYIVPSGITLLIPYNNTYTLYTTEPGTTTTYTTPTVRYKLTMNQGANIVVNGAMSLSAVVNYQGGNGNKSNLGSPSGDVSMVAMEIGSSITVNRGGSLYAWGYITGSGTVTAKDGSSVYECFQIMDYRGGSASSESKMGSYKIFPLSQYYVQNIEVPLTLEAGAKELGFTDVFIRSEQKQTVNFIGTSNSMFNISSGSVTKKYQGDTDRLIIDINGNVSLSSIKLTIGANLGIFAADINSADYVLPLNSNITINVNSGTVTINQDLALLPDTEVNIGPAGTVTLGSGKSVYVYDVDQWEEFVYAEYHPFSYNKDGNFYCLRLRALTYAPGRAAGVDRESQNMKDATIRVNGTLDASEGSIYTTYGPMTYKEGPTEGGEYQNHYAPEHPNNDPAYRDENVTLGREGGANIYSTASTGKVVINPPAATVAYQVIQDAWTKALGSTDDDADYYISIPISSAKLKNEVYDEKTLPLYTATADGSSTTYNYSAECGRWFAGEHAAFEEGSHVCECGAIRRVSIYGTSVRAGDSLGMYFYVEAEDLVAAGGDTTDGTYYAIVEHQKNDENNTVETSDQLVGELYEDTYYRFYFPGVAAKEMADELEVTIYWYNGTEYVPISMDYTESVQKYAMDLLNSISDDTTDDTEKALRTVLVDMLNYGAACQVHHDYNNVAENLANAQLTATQQGYATKIADITYDASASDTTGNLTKHSVSTESSLVYTFFFKNVDSNTTATVTYTDHYGNPQTLKNVPVNYSDSDALYYVDVTGLAVANGAAELSRESDSRNSVDITCTVTVGGSKVSVTGSIEAYLRNATASEDYTTNPNFKSVIDCLACFATSAYEYFRIVSP